MSLIECPICYDDKEEYMTLVCGHQFCNDCIGQSIIHDGFKKCPLCRTPIINYSVNLNHNMEIEEEVEVPVVGNHIENFNDDDEYNCDCNRDQECYLNIITSFLGLILVIFLVFVSQKYI